MWTHFIPGLKAGESFDHEVKIILVGWRAGLSGGVLAHHMRPWVPPPSTEQDTAAATRLSQT